MDQSHDEIRKELQEWNRAYNGGKDVDDPHIRNGIEFWRVGHNASHEFHAGAMDGKRFRYSVDCAVDYEDWPEKRAGEDDGEYVLRALGAEIKEVTDFCGYYG